MKKEKTIFTYPRKFPSKRYSKIHKIDIGGVSFFLTTGEYDDGTLGEIFIDINKEGSTLRSMFNCLAIAISLGLQYGVPLKTFVSFFSYMKFEPSGVVVGYNRIKKGYSIVDVIFRLLGIQYLKLEEYADDTSGTGDTIHKSVSDL
jgi:ribonucleoside-diphosphate reductase alpha chain